jgi:hypothetical protein
MEFPFDLEDVIGAAMASVVKRMLALASCLLFGWFLVGMAAVFMEAVVWAWEKNSGSGAYWPYDITDVSWELFFAPFVPIFTSWAALYVPFLIGLAFYYVKADMPSLSVWGGATGVIGLFALFSFDFYDSWEGWVVLALWLILLAGVFFFLKWWSVLRRVRAEQHLIWVGHENAMRRREECEALDEPVEDRELAMAVETNDQEGDE